jgi:hypothetical protein
MSPLLTVQTLRSLGVTLHLLITSSRQPVTGVSGVYLLSPTPTNVDLLIEDVNKGLYPEGVHINWTTKLSRELLERLGRGLVQGGNQVRKWKLQRLEVAAIGSCSDWKLQRLGVTAIAVEGGSEIILSG